MEDHKKRSKKRSQNKRPTAEQIKKLQTTIERKKINGVQEEPNHTTNSLENFENLREVELKSENHLFETNVNNKKNKKKNKQKNKQLNESVNPSTNGHVEQIDVIIDHAKSNGMLNEVNIKKENDTAIGGKEISQTTVSISSKTSNNYDCSQQNMNVTSNCHQYHENEAPTCSHHMNNINMGNFKIDFDVQKQLSALSSPLGSNQEYFYKGLNVENLEMINKEVTGESDDVITDQNSLEENRHEKMQIIQDQIGIATVNNRQMSLKNLFSNDDSESKSSEPQYNMSLPLDPNVLLQKMLAKEESNGAPTLSPYESMFASNEIQAFNPEKILKDMFEGEGEQVNLSIDPAEMLNKMLGLNGSQMFSGLNPLDMMNKIFGGVSTEENSCFNPTEINKTMMDKEGNQDNLHSEQPVDIQLPDMFSQINEMAKHIDPTLMSNMTKIVANMDPTLLMGMNNMVFGMMQSSGFQDTLQNIKQMKTKSVQDSEAINVDLSNLHQKGDLEKITDMQVKYEDTMNRDLQNKNETIAAESLLSIDEKISNIIGTSNAISECRNFQGQISEENVSVKGACDLDEKTDNLSTEGRFSFSSITSKSSKKYNQEELQITNKYSENEGKMDVKKLKRFEREESIPELLENLTKNDENKEIKIDRIEIKTNKFKTILNKVLRKEKKSFEGNSSKIEIHKERIEYEKIKKPTRANLKESRETVIEKIDYERLQHVKEPMEAPVKEAVTSGAKVKNQLKSDQVPAIEQNKEDTKSEITGESNRDGLKLLELGENTVPDEYIEFTPESMNEIFTNLLQGKKMQQVISGSDITPEKSVENPVANMLNNFTNLFEGPAYKREEEENADTSNSVPGSENANTIPMTMQQNISNIFGSLLQQKIPRDETSSRSEAQVNNIDGLENVMGQMISAFSHPSSDATQNYSKVLRPLGNQVNLFQNLQQTLIQQHSPTSKEPENQSFEKLKMNMSDMFENMVSNKDENTLADIQNIFQNDTNMKGILQMGQMLFGKSSDDEAEVDEESCKLSENKPCESEEQSTCEKDEIEDNEELTIVHYSKNMYQHERPSVLLKELLGEGFWNIRKKRINVKMDQHTKLKYDMKDNEKNKTIEIENPSETKTSETSDKKVSEELETMQFDLQKELEKESPLVRMLHKKIQKDTKLQQFLKEKLQKDPKMQQFIQERLQKDERIQKFMREKLAKDKNLRKTFEDKFRNDLGLTNILPKFEDDNNDNFIQEKLPTDSKKSNDSPDKLSKSDETKENLNKNIEIKEKKNTGLLLKKYAELTILMISIVYMGILCY